ncbi:MAG: DUF1800 domain-containing protein [Rhodospirillaceae bacterium]
MLPATPDPMRAALNRVTFGARDTDVAYANSLGWTAWVNEQLNAPPGDDPDLATHLAAQTMRIQYAAPNPATQPNGTWVATDEMRPLNYLNQTIPELYNVATRAGREFANQERTRIRQELLAATWIRNAHSRYQLREFMTDFWHNHFNIGKNENEICTALLPVYDRVSIRPHVFGNFRTMLEANANAPSMLLYLDNYLSTSTTPNENYAREIMELHTLGEDAYFGVGDTGIVPRDSFFNIPIGFTDQDVIQASRALSGWTIQTGQRVGTTTLPATGEFVYNANQHNTRAGLILGVDMAPLTAPQAQGRRFLDIIAAHPATARFVCAKLCRRIFGEAHSAHVLPRAISAWNRYAAMPDQIAHVLRAILLEGDDVFTQLPLKVRRPYERLLALFRTTDMVVNAATTMTTVLDPLNDALFAWGAPDGRPDVNDYWLATGATLTTWNLLFQFPNMTSIRTSLSAQTPASATTATAVVEYWVGRMIGHELPASVMNVLVGDQTSAAGVIGARNTTSNTANNVEIAHRRLVSLIATTEQFSLR